MKTLTKALALSAVLGASALVAMPAQAWFGPWGGGGGPWGGNRSWDDWSDGSGFGDFDMSMRGSGYGRGYNRYNDNYGYGPGYGGYGYPGYGGGYPGYGGYGGGYPGYYGAPYGMQPPVVVQQPAAPVEKK